MPTTDLNALVADLTDAHMRSTAVVGREPDGVRAVEAGPAGRSYLCAFGDGTVLCLDRAGEVVRDPELVRTALCAALLVEEMERAIDPAELGALAGLARKVAALTEAQVADALSELSDATERLARWRAAPERALATVVMLDEAVAHHDAARRAHLKFIAATDPLVPIQDTLSADVQAGLRDVEVACGACGIGSPLAAVLGQAVEQADAGARELLARSAVPHNA